MKVKFKIDERTNGAYMLYVTIYYACIYLDFHIRLAYLCYFDCSESL